MTGGVENEKAPHRRSIGRCGALRGSQSSVTGLPLPVVGSDQTHAVTGRSGLTGSWPNQVTRPCPGCARVSPSVARVSFSMGGSSQGVSSSWTALNTSMSYLV